MRFLFCSLASPGFLFPAIGMAKELHRRGHSIAFVTGMQFVEELACSGFERIPRGVKDGQSFQAAIWAEPISIALQVKHIEYAVQVFKPDVLVGQQLALGPFMVAERQHLPIGVIGLMNYQWPASEPAAAVEDLPVWERRKLFRFKELVRLYNVARDAFNLPAIDADFRRTPLLGDLFMVRSVTELEGSIAHLPECVHLVGSCLWEPDSVDPELDEWLAQASESRQQLIYVQQGRSFCIPSFWPTLKKAFADTEFRVVASTGRMDGEVGVLPHNFFARPHIPQGRVLRQADAVIASANTTVALGALTFGVPSLMIPAGSEQPEIAKLCFQLGIARVLEPEAVTAESLRQNLEHLLGNTSFRERAVFYSTALVKAQGFGTAADLLEILAKTGKPVLRERDEDIRGTGCLEFRTEAASDRAILMQIESG